MKTAPNRPVSRAASPAGPLRRPMPPVQKTQDTAASREKKPIASTTMPAHDPPEAW